MHKHENFFAKQRLVILMKNNKPMFLCELPPPYGGVTVKNQLIIDNVFNNIEDVDVLDFMSCKRNPLKIFSLFFSLIKAFISHRTIIYGFGSYKRLRSALKLQSFFGGKKSIQNTVNIVMGGAFQDRLKNDSEYIKLISRIKVSLVETNGMKEKLNALGLKNVGVFPNAKSLDMSVSAKQRANDDTVIKCVFFSQISREKGVDEIIKMNALLSWQEKEKIQIDFYGHIADNFHDEFSEFINDNSNVDYKGVFDSAKGNVCKKLHEYDVLLFPTKWKGEGVPGILVESKMAGIVPIVSDHLYNSEIVIDNAEGIVLKNNTAEDLHQAIIKIMNDSVLFNNLAKGSFESRKRYALETYQEMFEKLLNNGKD